MRTALAGAIAGLTFAAALQAQPAATHTAATPAAATRHWTPAPAVFPPGAQMAVVRGNPERRGPFTVELSMPDGYRIPPHFHPMAERILVRSGTFLVGMGDTLDVAKTRRWSAGAQGSVPARMHHHAVTRGATVVSVSANGPFAMTYVNAGDDPRHAAPTP